jgi:hypothetical protein
VGKDKRSRRREVGQRVDGGGGRGGREMLASSECALLAMQWSVDVVLVSVCPAEGKRNLLPYYSS